MQRKHGGSGLVSRPATRSSSLPYFLSQLVTHDVVCRGAKLFFVFFDRLCEAEKRTKTKKHGREEDDEDEEIEGEETRQTKNSEQGEKRRKLAMELESLI